MAGDDYRMAGGESRMTGDCSRADGIQPDLYIDAYARIHTCVPYIYGLVALLDSLQSSFSSITISIGYEPGARYYFYLTILKEPQEP